jgi:hypothetical protein
MAAIVFAANNNIAQHAQINNIIWPMDTSVFRADIFFFFLVDKLLYPSYPLPYFSLSLSLSLSLYVSFSPFFIIRYNYF